MFASSSWCWKATFRSAPLLESILLNQWHEQTRIFRWQWLAHAAVWLHCRRGAPGIINEAKVEAYRPGSNVIPMRFDHDHRNRMRRRSGTGASRANV